ncbi:MAG: hypothetical protein QXR05_06480 [Candidatus Methanomethylicia archaeon]
MGNISGDEVYVRIVFENLGETYESKCIEAETHKDIKIMESKDNKIIISIYSDGISGLIRDVSSFIALKNKEKAIKIHREASRKLIESRIMEKDKSQEPSHELNNKETQDSENVQYGRFGYIQGKEGEWSWKIYMDVLGQRRSSENYNHSIIKKSEGSKSFRIDFLTTEQWPYPEGEPMIWQYNAFKVYIQTSIGNLDPFDPEPRGNVDYRYFIFPLYLPSIGFITVEIWWAQVIASTSEPDSQRLYWDNYGPRKQYPDYLGWNEIFGYLNGRNGRRPNDVGVEFDMNPKDIGSYKMKVWGNVLIHQYEEGYLVSHQVNFPSTMYNIVVIP